MAMQSPGCVLSPSSTLMTIERWPSVFVAKRSVCRGRQRRVARNEHDVLLAERVVVDAFDAQAVGIDVRHLERALGRSGSRGQQVAGKERRAAGDRFIGIDGAIGLDARSAFCSMRATIGIRVEPPTSRTRCKSFHSSPATASTCREVYAVRSSRSADISSNCSRVTALPASGPDS